MAENLSVTKEIIRYLGQKILGLQLFLFLFALIKIPLLKWDPQENDFFKFIQILRKGDKGIILDVGANIGLMTYHLSKSFKESTIYSIEPLPENLSILKRIINFFNIKNVKVLEYAVGEEDGQAILILPEVNNSKMPGLTHILHDSIKDYNEGEVYKVQIRRIDNLISINESNKVVGIKIDIENFEYFALAGAIETIKRFRPFIYIELWDNKLRKKSIDFIKKLNYEVNYFDGNQLKTFDSSKPIDVHNLIFSPYKTSLS